jgi:hypothetical protein
MKILLLYILVYLVPSLSVGQSMSSIFELLPKECTPELNLQQKRILLKDKDYIIPGGDSLETTKYTLEIDEANQYLRYEFYFTTGQKGFNDYEVRKFRKSNGSVLIVFSASGGVTRSFDQTEIYAFEYRNKRLIKLNKKILPQSVDANIFFKKDAPDSIKQKAILYSSRSYDLSPDLKNNISYRIFFEILNEEIEKYLLGDIILFTWTGNLFKRKKGPYFD